MELECRQIIRKYKDRFSKSIDLNKLRPLLKESMLFTNSMLSDIYTEPERYNFYDELQTRGPQAFRAFIDILKKSGYAAEAEALEKGASRISKRFFYKMSSRPIGQCVIINNVHFYEGDRHEERFGSELDVNALRTILDRIGYDVAVYDDVSSDGIKRILADRAQSKSLRDVDSFILVVLSHGGRHYNEDVVFGSDSFFVTKEEIYTIFNNKMCPNLQWKPKVFFFQACRGRDEDDGVPEEASNGPKVTPPDIKESTDATDESWMSDVEIKPRKTVVKHPTMTDMLAVHSALPGYSSYREHDNGSWLCQDLAEVLEDDYLDHDLETMLKVVSRKMQGRVSREFKKQVLHLENIGLIGDIHFGRKGENVEMEKLENREGYFA